MILKTSLIFLIITSICTSCFLTDSDAEYRIEYIFVNKTTHQIDLSLMGDVVKNNSLSKNTEVTNSINPEEKISFEEVGWLTKTVDNHSTKDIKRNGTLGDSMKIVFDDTRYLIYYQNEQLGNDSTYLISSYQYNKIDDYKATFTFNITEDEYNKSIYLK